jgi:hypothetical protein
MSLALMWRWCWRHGSSILFVLLVSGTQQNKAGEMTWRLLGTCLCTFCAAVYLGKASKPTRSRSATRRSARLKGPLLSRCFAKAIPVRILLVS